MATDVQKFNAAVRSVFTADVVEALKALGFDPSSAGFANSIWGGRNILDSFTEAQVQAKIAKGDFSGLAIGDYITKTITVDGTSYTVKWLCAGFNHYLYAGDTACTTPHIAMIPEGIIGTAQMNTTNTTAGGFKGSQMWTTTLPKYVTAVKNVFGATHVLKHRDYISSSMHTSLASMAGCGWAGAVPGWGCTWTDVYLSLPSEIEVYGSTCASSSMFDIGVKHQQLPLFRLNPSLVNCCSNWWLSAVGCDVLFTDVYFDGVVLAGNATELYGVRPVFCWC